MGTTQIYFELIIDNGWIVRLQPNQFFKISASSTFTEEIEKVDTSWKVELVMSEFQVEQ